VVKNKTVYMRTLQCAADLVGDAEVLAALMGVQRGDLLEWLAGKSQPSTAAFLVAVDIVNNQERIATAQLKAGTTRERDADIAKLKKAG
jgi:hypothetical protein